MLRISGVTVSKLIARAGGTGSVHPYVNVYKELVP
jgi:hypothetical protein